MNTQKQIFLIVVLFFMFIGACAGYAAIDLPIRADDQAQWHKDESIERGALLFANNCRTCHGNMGQGGVGLPLNIAEYKNQDPLVLKNNIAKIKRTLECGRAGTRMQPWLNTNGGALNERQLEHLIDLITAPADSEELDAEGNPTSHGWVEAVEFAHNLNRETAVIVGGETLDTIAADHQVGSAELSKLNGNIDVNQVLKEGSHVQLPPTKDDPDGRRYLVRNDNETLAKIASSQHVGGIILAELNNIPYKFDADEGTFTLLGDDGNPIPGLFPGARLALPEGATYVVKAGDTLQKIADQHGISVSQLTGGPNARVLSTTNPTEELEAKRLLELPPDAKAVVQPSDTVATIATAHGIDPQDLIDANEGLTADTVLAPGQQLELPDDARYEVQKGDTLTKIARVEHANVTEDQLIQLNDIDPNAPFGPDIVLQLPKVNAYTVTGQSLEDLAKTYSNVTAESLAEANNVPANAVLRIGQNLRLPDDAWGSAPSDAINPGTACVQFAVPDSTFQTLPGLATPEAETEKPTQAANEVVITANANDWTVTADGTEMEPNKGVVLVKAGSTINFVNKTGLHTIDVNGEKQGDDFTQGQTREVSFPTAGEYKITCEYHPAMLATVFVE
ncbi:MAG: LysM peptidoglycan-binding domain-containing protein [Hyphomicrobiales bacterium]